MSSTDPQSTARRWWPLAAAVLSMALILVGVRLYRGPAPEASQPDAAAKGDGPGKSPAAGTLPNADRVRDPDAAKVDAFDASWTPEGLPPMAPPPKGAFGQDFIKGAALGLYLELPGLSYAELFKEIKALGATHVSMVVAWSQPTVRSVNIGPDPVETVPDERVKAYIQQAHAAGLKVMLFPILHVNRRRSGEWRGHLQPVDPQRWWASYEGFILHYAQLAQQEKVDILSVGSELLAQESQREPWSGLIAKVRGQYKGKLTYSANWDHFDHVTYWDLLDIAGMTGYFELSDSPRPNLDELKETWEGVADVISVYSERSKRPVMLTEVGYPSQTGSASHPWDYTLRNPPDMEVQYLCFRAMYEVYAKKMAAWPKDKPTPLSGFFVWEWYGYGGPKDVGYTLRGKPAQAVIKRWFEPTPTQDPAP